MAFVEKYVSSLAGGAGDGSSGNPWTLAQAIADTSSDRINIKADGTYTHTATSTLAGAGSNGTPKVWRGYLTTLGDGYQGRSNSGTGPLATTNMPLINCTGNGRFALGVNTIFEGLRITRTSASTTGSLLTGAAKSFLNHCVVSDGSTGAAAATATFPLIMDCDIEQTGGASGSTACSTTGNQRVFFSRLSAPAGACALLAGSTGGVVILNCIFLPGVDGVKITGTTSSAATNLLLRNNTAYGLTGSFLELPNAILSATAVFPQLINNHVTDCGYFARSLYAPTDNVPIFRSHNRTRDNANADTGFGDWPDENRVTTDTGNYTTDYVDAPNGDFRLIAGAPGVGTGWPVNTDIGALKIAGSSGGGSFIGSSFIARGLIS